ncbi:hypothetical protein M378DRAFT_18869 [Amanita muscaria Koide BX008]|uniref:Uncharacterized protein n=1 Tax=Amanita muscaria (strain Koide BX008) TaxID=946122 RepID=A0A0C2WD03_AMAMK|nr:hypothetical protein M378DRAFT_18869 [Amanita muscaria Koide BX008]
MWIAKCQIHLATNVDEKDIGQTIVSLKQKWDKEVSNLKETCGLQTATLRERNDSETKEEEEETLEGKEEDAENLGEKARDTRFMPLKKITMKMKRKKMMRMPKKKQTWACPEVFTLSHINLPGPGGRIWQETPAKLYLDSTETLVGVPVKDCLESMPSP